MHVYFDNDAKVHAPFDAQRLAGMLGVERRQAKPTIHENARRPEVSEP